jgi:hypothetical protein
MTELSDIERLRQRDYRYAVTKMGSTFIVTIEELSLIATGAALDDCMATIEREKEELFKTFAALKRADSLPMPGSLSSSIPHSKSSLSFTNFLMYSAMAAIIFCMGMVAFGLVVTQQIRQNTNYATISQLTGRIAINILEDLGSPKGPDWYRGMDNLRQARNRYLEVMEILNGAPEEKKQNPKK